MLEQQYPVSRIPGPGRRYYLLPPPNKYSAEDSSLIADLIKLSNKHPKLVKSTKHVTPFDPNIYLQSWKMNEYKYHDIPQARWRVELPEGMGRRHIVMSFRL